MKKGGQKGQGRKEGQKRTWNRKADKERGAKNDKEEG